MQTGDILNCLLYSLTLDDSSVDQAIATLQTETDSVDPNEMAHNEPSHQNLHCLPFCHCFLTSTPVSNCGHFRN